MYLIEKIHMFLWMMVNRQNKMQLHKLKRWFYFCLEVIPPLMEVPGTESTVMLGEEPIFFSKNFEPLVCLNGLLWWLRQ